jgi:hypothetical protein
MCVFCKTFSCDVGCLLYWCLSQKSTIDGLMNTTKAILYQIINCTFSKWNGKDTSNKAKYSIVDRKGFKTSYWSYRDCTSCCIKIWRMENCFMIEVHIYLRLNTTKSSIGSNYIYFARGDMLRPLMQPSSGQLKCRESTLMLAWRWLH